MVTVDTIIKPNVGLGINCTRFLHKHTLYGWLNGYTVLENNTSAIVGLHYKAGQLRFGVCTYLSHNY